MDKTGHTSLLVLPSRRGRTGKHAVDDYATYRNDWNGLQRLEQRISVWIAGDQDEDPWEYNIALRKRSCYTFCPRCSCLLARAELPAHDSSRLMAGR